MIRTTFRCFIFPLGVLFILLTGCKSKTPANVEAPANAVIGLEIGNLAPEMAYPSPDGNTIALSSLRGKLVLVDFWASWCMPCRIENPNLVKVYKRYKNKTFSAGDGFTIYSVSLDTKAESWKDAIAHDGLSWESHVSDLKGFHSVAAASYQITSIPSNLLLNGQGIIIARNLRSEALEKAIAELVQ